MTEETRASAAIEVVHLSKTYREQKDQVIHAVQDLNLVVPQGQVLGFLGANGAGKTTTIKMICGLITPTQGKIYVGGYDVTRQHSSAMRQIGVVLEGTRNIYWRLTPWQNLMYFGQVKQCWGKSLRLRAEQLLRELDLWDRRHDTIRTFSRGMQQKVAIACALIADPPIILLDEPTLGLDIQAARTVKEWITRLSREQGKTVVLTTHQLDMAQELCDRVAIMRKGVLLADQPLTELLHVFQQESYQICVKAPVTPEQLGRFSSLSLNIENNETVLTGVLSGQDELYELLTLLRSLALPLTSVERVEPNLEEVFINLVEEQQRSSVLLQGAHS